MPRKWCVVEQPCGQPALHILGKLEMRIVSTRGSLDSNPRKDDPQGHTHERRHVICTQTIGSGFNGCLVLFKKMPSDIKSIELEKLIDIDEDMLEPHRYIWLSMISLIYIELESLASRLNFESSIYFTL